MADGVQRVGRGGAGNIVSERGRNASQRADDSEAQKLSAPAHVPAQPPSPARAGRGGAGNFHDPAKVQDASREQVAERAGTAVASPAAGRSGLTGRGGAGNFADNRTTPKDEEARKREELADEAARNVDAELPMPPKIYTPPLKEDS